MLDKFTAYAKTVDAEFENTYTLKKGANPGGTASIQGNYYELLNSIISFNRVSSGARIDFGNAEKRMDVVEWNKFVRLFKGFTAERDLQHRIYAAERDVHGEEFLLYRLRFL